MKETVEEQRVADGSPISRTEIPSPAPHPGAGLPAHLQNLTDRARGYVEAASSINTRKAYSSDWKHFSAWCRRSNLSPLPRSRKRSVSTSRHVPRDPWTVEPSQIPFRRSSAACLRFPGTIPNAAWLSTARIGTSQLSWPVSATATPNRRCRRKRSWQPISSP